MEQKISDLKDLHKDLINETLKVIRQKWTLQNDIMMKYVGTIKWARKLKKCTNAVVLIADNQIQNTRNKISEYEKNQEEYRIELNFNWKDSSLEFKTEVINMIDQLKVNHKVGRLMLKLAASNPINY